MTITANHMDILNFAVKDARKRGITRAQISAESGVCEPTIRRIKKGQQGMMGNWSAIIVACGFEDEILVTIKRKVKFQVCNIRELTRLQIDYLRSLLPDNYESKRNDTVIGYFYGEYGTYTGVDTQHEYVSYDYMIELIGEL